MYTETVKSMDDASLKYYLNRHIREITNLERRIQLLRSHVAEEMREMNLRGLND